MKPQSSISGDAPTGISHMDAGGQTSQDNVKSPSIFKRTAAEFLGAVGFVSMFAAVGNALIPAIVGGAAAFTATAGITIAVGLAIGLAAMAGSAAIKRSMENDGKQAKEAEEKQHAKPTQVIVNNLQIQPNVDIETSTKVFTKIIEAERAQAGQNPGQQK